MNAGFSVELRQCRGDVLLVKNGHTKPRSFSSVAKFIEREYDFNRRSGSAQACHLKKGSRLRSCDRAEKGSPWQYDRHPIGDDSELIREYVERFGNADQVRNSAASRFARG